MQRLIGQKVKSKLYGDGLVIQCLDEVGSRRIIIKFNDTEKELGYDIVIENKIITFENEEMQILAEEIKNKGKILEIPTYTNNAQLRKEAKNYGSCAQSIYLKLCEELGWDESLSYKFGSRQKCYAKEVDGVNAAWFVVHSNLSGDKHDCYTNTFKNKDGIDKAIIEEEYIPSTSTVDYRISLGDIRIVFYKSKEYGGYLFAGVYEQTNHYINEKGNHVLVYEMIYDYYPFREK